MDNFSFGTKAETLEGLISLVKNASVGELYYFSVNRWEESRKIIQEEMENNFRNSKYLAIRSSAQAEDGFNRSMAGRFRSILGVDRADWKRVWGAINKVIASYPGNSHDQVLIQAMVNDVAVSGVIMTRNLEDGAPYYVFNYDDNSGRTDSVTGGTGVHKTVMISRNASKHYIESPRLKKMLSLARELEGICGGIPLDIEFGMTRDERLHLFQVRPISVSGKWHSGIERRVNNALPDIEKLVKERSRPTRGIFGKRTIFTTMSDWNPAEIIGVIPRPLAASLYRDLITRDTWRIGRERMGYRRMPDEELMVMIGGRPYIDVRNSFNSFLPEGLDDAVCAKLVDAWLDRLDEHPELHDKVEFEVAQTCMDFVLNENLALRYRDFLSSSERELFRKSLLSLTLKCLDLGPSGTLGRALCEIDELAESQKRKGKGEALLQVADLLEKCRKFGTLPFSVIARHAFIAESLLRSAVRKGAISEERLGCFKKSIKTVTSRLVSDMADACKGGISREEFMERYGHLRPGTYDIMSRSYRERIGLFNGSFVSRRDSGITPFSLSRKEKSAIDKLLLETDITGTDAEGLFEYAKRAICGREYSKFVFTKNISNALDTLLAWGRGLNLGPEKLSYLDIGSILNTLAGSFGGNDESRFAESAEKGKRALMLARELKLSYIIRGEGDIYVVPMHRSAPNFIGSETIEGAVLTVNAGTPADAELYGKIICVENADPGFDWVFTKGIKALVTKYGGANSHMAIRCAEFGLPAAIGCGEVTFECIVKAGAAELNCVNKILRPLYA